MSDWTVAELAEEYRAGRVTRRQFIARMLSVGLGAPVIASVLAACGSSSNNSNKAASTNAGGATTAAKASGSPGAGAKDTFQPTKRGGGGTLKLLWWQGPTTLNAHISNGTKDFDGSRIFTEPLAGWDSDANLFPILAAELPSAEKGTVAKDGTSVTWKLKQGVTWHDGKPLTADDVVFTFQYITDPTTASTSVGTYANVASVDKVDDTTVKITFKEPTAYWQGVFTAGYGHIFPKHLIEQYKGKEARNSPYNLKPVGTGPYKIVDFKPGDSIIAEINPNYHVPNRPFFDRLELKGGGDAPSAARAVLQTGDYDYAWNMQVEDTILKDLEKSGQGKVVIYDGASTEHIQLNPTDPNTEIDGEKSSIKSKHPFFSDLAVRKAFTLMMDRKVISDQLYGRTGKAATYYLFNPQKYVPSPASTWEFNLQKAGDMLDAAGWKKGSDGVRAKDGKKMKVLFQTSVNDLRQNEQAIVKKALESLGIQVELKSVNAGVFFGDATNPDSFPHFYADMQMYTNGPSDPDPLSFFRQWYSAEVAQKANSWSKLNPYRYQNPAYDKLWDTAKAELDPIKRADLYKKMSQLPIDDVSFVPLVNRTGTSAVKNGLQGYELNAFDSNLWKLAYWYRKT